MTKIKCTENNRHKVSFILYYDKFSNKITSLHQNMNQKNNFLSSTFVGHDKSACLESNIKIFIANFNTL